MHTLSTHFLYRIVEIPRLRHDSGMITPEQSRAARGLLGWTQQELANKAGVGVVTVHQLEAGMSQPRRATLEVIRRAFEIAGVEFIDENGGGRGVRLRKRARPRGQRSNDPLEGGINVDTCQVFRLISALIPLRHCSYDA